MNVGDIVKPKYSTDEYTICKHLFAGIEFYCVRNEKLDKCLLSRRELSELEKEVRKNIDYQLIEKNNMNNTIVKVENKEYVWQEIAGKGKCLVPCKTKFNKLKIG